ncbi:MAG: hypothetical protein E7258_02025 [Lachnospiraceae bacterium]|nr:hypothetical protein [Lachnospiraceae bacterium]
MIQLVKLEISKALKTKGFFVAIGIGLVISILQSYWFYNNVFTNNNEIFEYLMSLSPTDSHYYDLWFENVFLEGWLGCEVYSPYNNLFYLAMPLLAVLPFGHSLYMEWNKGYSSQILIRSNRKKYFTAKFLAVFMSGGLAIAIPLIFNLIITVCYLPIIPGDPVSAQVAVFNIGLWPDLYFNHPLLYAFAYIALDFICGGLMACMALTVTHFFDSVFAVMLFPLLLNCILYYGLDSIEPASRIYNISWFVNPGQPGIRNDFNAVIITSGIWFLLLVILHFASNIKRDVIKER